MLSREELIFMININMARYIIIFILNIIEMIALIVLLLFKFLSKEKELNKMCTFVLIIAKINIILICISCYFYNVDESLKNALLEIRQYEVELIKKHILLICGVLLAKKIKIKLK